MPYLKLTSVMTAMDTMRFEYDPERLIEEVKKRPGIWDFEDVDYRSKPIRCKLWAQIVAEMMGNDVKVSKSDAREIELQLQKKWKSMRDCFQKYITNPKRTQRPYIYLKHLQFLLKNTKKSLPNEERYLERSSDSDGEHPKKTWKSKKKIKITKYSSDEDNIQDESNDITQDFVEVDMSQNSMNANKTADEFMFASVDHSRSDFEDADKMFLLSLLPHLKAVPEENRLNVKMDLMQVLKNASYIMSHDQKGF